MAGRSKSIKSWERQPKESVQAYEAFSLYLELGYKRTVRKVAQDLNKSLSLIGGWSSTWNWQQRSADYDAELKRQEFEEAKKAIKKMQERHIQTAMLLQKKALQALEKKDIESFTPQEILRFITEGAKLEKATREEANPATENANGPGSLADTIIAAYEKRRGGGGE
ncbi:MAG: hypothetical protein IJX94_01305 [Clostridia bacterium]|nr:hypothetical protein [Clostridia bacterium]